jgi:hypothetical protein
VSIDFPRAWELARSTAPEDHHPECSYAVTGGAFVCDLICPVISENREFGCEAMHSRGGEVLHGTCTCPAQAQPVSSTVA